jgi:mannosyltransferase
MRVAMWKDQRSRHLIILAIIILAASILRLHGLEVQSLSNDELSSWRQSSYGRLADVIQKGVRPDVHPPAYQILLFFVIRLIGDDPWALRLSSAIFGVISVIVIYYVGCRLFSRDEALTSAAFLAVMWFPVYYSQDARSYSMMLLFTLISTYFLISLIEELRDEYMRPRTAVAYIASASILAYTHYFGLLMVALQGLFMFLLFVSRPRKLVSVLFVVGALCLVYVPWIPAMREHLAVDSIWIGSPNRNFFKAFNRHLEYVFNKSRAIEMSALLIYILLFVRMGFDLARNLSWKNIRHVLASRESALILWLIVPFAVAYVKSRLSVPILTNRNMIIVLPAACLLLGRSFTRLPFTRSIRVLAVTAASFFLLYYLVFPMQYYRKPVKAQFREAVQFALKSVHFDNDALIASNVNYAEYVDYYFEKLGSDRRIDVLFKEVGDWGKIERALRRESKKCIFYICAGKREKGLMKKIHKQGYEQIAYGAWKNSRVAVYRKESSAASEREDRRKAALADMRSLPEWLWIQGRNEQDPEKRIEYYRKLIEQYPEHELAPQALFMIVFVYGEIIGDTASAVAAYKELLDTYPHSDVVESATWSIQKLRKPPSATEDAGASRGMEH